MRKLLLVWGLLIAGCMSANGQGCSDAGFCSMGAMQSGSKANQDTAGKNAAGLSLSAGAGENNTFITTLQAELKLSTGAHSYVEARLPFYTASGNLGSHSGLGDIMCTYTRADIFTAGKLSLSGTAGSRISTGNANAMDRGLTLPMPYQANLGTTDLILGLNSVYTSGKGSVTLAAGYQQPLVQYNDNTYVPSLLYPAATNDTIYFGSSHLKRKGDLLLRLEGSYAYKRVTLSAGPLFIYHLGTDEITDPSGNQLSLMGSDGLTLNLAGNVTFALNKYLLRLSGGTPLVVRDYRPDGLTRSWVATISVLRLF
jgi:hypothetical protein